MTAKTHVVEFMWSMLGVVPPPFHSAEYTSQKLKKPLAKERPGGCATRTSFTVEEINDMSNMATQLIDNSNDPEEVFQFVNLTMALGMTYEKGRRAGNVVPADQWTSADHLSRQAIADLVQSAAERQRRLDTGAVGSGEPPRRQDVVTLQRNRSPDDHQTDGIRPDG